MKTEETEINEKYEDDMLDYFKSKADSGIMASCKILAGKLVKNKYTNYKMDLTDFTQGDSDKYQIEIIVRIKEPFLKRLWKSISRKTVLRRHYNGVQANYLAITKK